MTDAAINISPDLEDKRDIVQNAIDLAHALGIAEPQGRHPVGGGDGECRRCASTLDAAALCKMADRGQITGGILDGPLAFDNACRTEAARPRASTRRSPAGPTSWWCRTWKPATCWPSNWSTWPRREAAGIVLGARVPIILTSRADKTLSRLASCAIALLLARHVRTGKTP